MLTILMSKQAEEAFGPDVHQVLGSAPYRVVNLDATPDAAGIYGVDIAFLSRDVTGSSGKTDLAPTLLRYYEILRGSPNLQWIQAHAAGSDRPIFAELHKRGVVVTTGSGTASIPVAQLALTGLLALSRRLPEMMNAQRRHSWEPFLPPRNPIDISEQSVVIVGLGPIGKEIARLCKTLGMSVYGIARTSREESCFDGVFCFEEANSILQKADFVVMACPLTEKTRGFLNYERLRILPRGARIINVARGEVVLEDDLIRAVNEGFVEGAFLDVFQKEPLDPKSALWDLPNVIVSPHAGAHTSNHYLAVGKLFIENLNRWYSNKPLLNLANFDG